MPLGPEDARDVAAVLQDAADGWNAGDLTRYLRCYVDSEATLYISGHEVFAGRQAIAARYRARYPDAASMGALALTIESTAGLGPDHAFVLARFSVAAGGPGSSAASGVATLIMRRTPDGWRVLIDHVS